MDRLFLPQFLSYAKKAVYLDIDIVVLGNIKELFSIDLEGSAIGARQTVFPGWSDGYSICQLIEKQLDPEQIRMFRNEFLYGQPLNYGCFNAGVQVMDLEKLRKLDFTTKLLNLVQNYGINDQFACNLFAAGDFKRLPYEWNHFATQEWIDKPKLIHYTGYIKPWDSEVCPKAAVWRSYIKDTDELKMASAFSKSWFK
jgi:lipopolysaccharide biosynthesis glycosyltransferase